MTHTEPYVRLGHPSVVRAPLVDNKRAARSYQELAEPLVLIRPADDENPCVVKSVN